MPLIEVARTKTKPDALAALDEWKTRHAGLVPALPPADILVDGMRGSSSLWYRVRVNLQHIPEDARPPQEELIADYDHGRVRSGRGASPALNDGIPGRSGAAEKSTAITSPARTRELRPVSRTHETTHVKMLAKVFCACFRRCECDQLGLDLGDAAGEIGRVGDFLEFGEFAGVGSGQDPGIDHALVRGERLVIDPGPSLCLFDRQPAASWRR